MKKVIAGLVVLGFLIIGVLIWPGNTREGSGFSVHDINWEDIEGMNEKVSSMTLNIPPHFMNQIVETYWDVTDLFRLFSENQDLLRDRPKVTGSTVRSDFEVVLEFANLTGDEAFLNNNGSDGIFNISFYVDRSLGQVSLDLWAEAMYAYDRAQNPGAFDDIITLSEVDWDVVMADYEYHITAITFTRPVGEWNASRQEYELEFGSFVPGQEKFSEILEFIRDHQESLSDNYNEDYMYSGSIHFSKSDDNEPWIIASFSMDSSLDTQLMEIIGEEAWEAEQERRQQEDENQYMRFNDDERVLSAEIEWDELRNNHEIYINRMLVGDISMIDYEDWAPEIELFSVTDLDWEIERFENVLEWLSENPDRYSEERLESGFVIFIRFRRSSESLEDERYADKIAWFFVSDEYWDEVMGY